MKYILLFLLNVVSIKFSNSNEQLQIAVRKTSVSNVIVSNYLNKYLNDECPFVAISISIANNHQKYFEEDLITNLLTNRRFEYLAYKIIRNINSSRGAFYLIFVDGISSLT